MSRISIRNVSYIYNQGMPFEKKALNNINLDIDAGEFIALIGHTGSGKSTLVQHLNGLNEPTMGEILYDGVNYREKGKKNRHITPKSRPGVSISGIPIV